MIHMMKLNDEPFTLIKAGTKVIELRLNDEKLARLLLLKFTN
jgi:ASC-1-like (ASCH) protein